MAAATDCLRGIDRNSIGGVLFASTSYSYKEKQAASVIAKALDLPREVRTADLGDSLRAGTTALRAAVDSVKAGSAKNVLVVASDSRMAAPRSPQERNFGDVRGTPYSELEFDLFAPDYDPPGGESWERFEVRMDAAWALIQRAAEECRENLAVITHGLVCRSVVSRRTRLPEGAEPDLGGLSWRNTSVTILDGPDPWRVRLLNCSAHLDDAEPERGGAV